MFFWVKFVDVSDLMESAETFDGKEVTEMAKQFLKNWQANKEAVKQKMLTRQSAPNLNSHGGHFESGFQFHSI